MTNIQINGVMFKVATAWAVDAAVLRFAAVEGGGDIAQGSAYDPTGLNAGGGDITGLVINSWTDTLIEIDYDETAYPPFLHSVQVYNYGQSQTVIFDVDPDLTMI